MNYTNKLRTVYYYTNIEIRNIYFLIFEKITLRKTYAFLPYIDTRVGYTAYTYVWRVDNK